MTSNKLHQTQDPRTKKTAPDKQTNRKRTLSDLNARYQTLSTAVNLIKDNADSASSQLDEDYNSERRAIINAREPDFDRDFELDTGLRT